MNIKEELLLRLKEEYDCMEIHFRNMTKAINEDDFNQAYDYVRAVVENSLNMEDLMMNYKRMKIADEATEAIKEGQWEDALNRLHRLCDCANFLMFKIAASGEYKSKQETANE